VQEVVLELAMGSNLNMRRCTVAHTWMYIPPRLIPEYRAAEYPEVVVVVNSKFTKNIFDLEKNIFFLHENP
jgi:hypothetical protein